MTEAEERDRMRKLIAGNWKMNGLESDLVEARRIAAGADRLGGAVDLALCPPATLVDRMRRAVAGSRLAIGGQDCHADESGAHTGDVSAEMLRDAGAVTVILGHSERRADHGETDAVVRAKAAAAWRAGLRPIVCVGETEAERDSGRALDVVAGQLAGSIPDDVSAFVVAYEPVWAIGTGRTPTEDDIAAVHAHIRDLLVRRFGGTGRDVPILYGGSMKPGNAAAILAVADVDGGLIGGASLKAADFLAIAEAASA